MQPRNNNLCPGRPPQGPQAPQGLRHAFAAFQADGTPCQRMCGLPAGNGHHRSTTCIQRASTSRSNEQELISGRVRRIGAPHVQLARTRSIPVSDVLHFAEPQHSLAMMHCELLYALVGTPPGGVQCGSSHAATLRGSFNSMRPRLHSRVPKCEGKCGGQRMPPHRLARVERQGGGGVWRAGSAVGVPATHVAAHQVSAQCWLRQAACARGCAGAIDGECMLQHACYAPRSRAQHLLLTSGPLPASLRLPKGLPVSSGVPENSAGCTIQLSGPFPSLVHV